MRVLVLKTIGIDPSHQTWRVAYTLPFAPVAAVNQPRYGLLGDCVELELAEDTEGHERRARDVFEKHVERMAAKEHCGISRHYVKKADIERWCAAGATLCWVTDHEKRVTTA